MNLGILTSAGIMCGVAEYAKNLAGGLQALGHQVTVFGNHGGEAIREEHRWMLLPDAELPSPLVRCFRAPLWSRAGGFDHPLIQAEIVGRRISTLIVQYQTMLYDAGGLLLLLQWCRSAGVWTVVCFHDSFVDLPQDLAGAKVVPGASLLQAVPGATVIPQGVHDLSLPSPDAVRARYGFPAASLGTFGFKTDHAFLHSVAERLGWHMVAFDPWNRCQIRSPRLRLYQGWFPRHEMITMLSACRAVVLWYPTAYALATSSGAALAAATRRPVILNENNHFHDLPRDVFTIVRSPDELVAALLRVPEDEGLARRQAAYIQQNSWTETARRYLALCR